MFKGIFNELEKKIIRGKVFPSKDCIEYKFEPHIFEKYLIFTNMNI